MEQQQLKLGEMRSNGGREIVSRSMSGRLRYMNIPPEYVDMKKQIFAEAEIIAKREGWVLYAICLEGEKIVLRFESGRPGYERTHAVTCTADVDRTAIIELPVVPPMSAVPEPVSAC